jgi:hypothetical protein
MGLLRAEEGGSAEEGGLGEGRKNRTGSHDQGHFSHQIVRPKNLQETTKSAVAQASMQALLSESAASLMVC